MEKWMEQIYSDPVVFGMKGPDGSWNDIGVSDGNGNFDLLEEYQKLLELLGGKGETHVSSDPEAPPVWDTMQQQMPQLSRTEATCPVSGHEHCISSVWGMIQHLNDSHRWSRERIADWLEETGNNPEFEAPED